MFMYVDFGQKIKQYVLIIKEKPVSHVVLICGLYHMVTLLPSKIAEIKERNQDSTKKYLSLLALF